MSWHVRFRTWIDTWSGIHTNRPEDGRVTYLDVIGEDDPLEVRKHRRIKAQGVTIQVFQLAVVDQARDDHLVLEYNFARKRPRPWKNKEEFNWLHPEH